VTHHVTHRLVRDYIGRGSHDIDVKMIRRTPREYQAVCLECDWKSAVGTGTEADKALVNHRDETVAAAQARGPAPAATLNPARDSTDNGDRVPTGRRLPMVKRGVSAPSGMRTALERVKGSVGNTQAGEQGDSIPNFIPIERGFRAAYRELEARMRALAEDDGDVFLPNPEPPGPVEHVFICMEPSLGSWARSLEEARAKVEADFRNFVFSIEDFILHFSIR
jgi:hypothetical protein